MTPSAALANIAYKLRIAPDTWTQDRPARNSVGMTAKPEALDAIAWCMVSLVVREPGPFEDGELFPYLERAIDSEFVGLWNDYPGRTVAQVIEAFERAAEIAKREGR